MRTTLSAFAFALTLCCFPITSSFAESGKAETEPLPNLKPLSKSQLSMREARAEVLSSLYDQLKNAETEESGELVASAIEKLWMQSGSDTADLLMERAGLAVKARKFDLATEILNNLTSLQPRYVAAWSQLATVYFMRENYVDSMHRLRQVLALDPYHFKAIEGVGIILRETGNKKAALAVTRRALAIYPHLKSAKKAEEELAREVEGQGI